MVSQNKSIEIWIEHNKSPLTNILSSIEIVHFLIEYSDIANEWGNYGAVDVKLII